jgi:hypothetical protein
VGIVGSAHLTVPPGAHPPDDHGDAQGDRAPERDSAEDGESDIHVTPS